jgi:hypothetical protein
MGVLTEDTLVESHSMSLTDRVTIAIEVYQDGARLDGGDEALTALIASIPYAGSAIGSILSGRAQRQMHERAADVFEAFKQRLEQLEGQKIDKTFFESDEFLTLFTLTLEQLQTTHDKTKLKMLAVGLANSATIHFTLENRKELFFRILRDLAPEHVSMMQNKLWRPEPHGLGGRVRMPYHSPSGDSLAILQHLASQGLVTESLHVEKVPSINMNQINQSTYNRVQEYLERPPSKSYSLSDFGFQFLQFFESETCKQS